jgi:uncharacterized delta-60 repeat protein/uncharacterized repeat protein (TIGR01451 family)
MSCKLQNITRGAGLVKLGLMVLIGLAANVGRTQGTFAGAVQLTGDSGSVTYNNFFATPESGGPSTAGLSPNKPVWYKWTAPADGQVALDTIGSADGVFAPLDTVLGVYTGTDVTKLSQVAANDDIYPFWQINEYGVNVYVTNYQGSDSLAAFTANYPSLYSPYLSTNPFAGAIAADYYQPFAGPSGLRFNATAGTTYYFAVDTRGGTRLYHSYYTNASPDVFSAAMGNVVLNWAFHPSGVFRFATEYVDQTGIRQANGMPMLLYQCAETESVEPIGEFGNVDAKTVVNTWHTYNNPGMMVTVTRVAGSSGRVLVDYRTVDGANFGNCDIPAKANVDYGAVFGTLVFDDFEMSKTFLIPILPDGGIPRPNRSFTVVLSNPRLDPGESSDVSPPRVDPNFGQAVVRILDVDIAPRGESGPTRYFTTNIIPGFTNITTNILWTITPTNAVFNFQKAHYRVARDVSNFWGATPVTIYVNRTGTNDAGTTAFWRINNYFLELQPGYDQQNMLFPLQPGSDYAMPSPPTANALIEGASPPDTGDFTNSGGNFGTLTWGSQDFRPKAIHFMVLNNGLTSFNRDLTLELYRPNAKDATIADQIGMVAETTVTIMFDDQHPPPGSVDELYNADYNLSLALPPARIPVTTPANNPHPGTDGEVYGLAVLPNNETVIVGTFSSYDTVARKCIALVNTNGMLDTSFNPGSGAGGGFQGSPSINAVALASGKFVIGGGFTSFNGTSRGGVARLNAIGTVDTGFNPGTGADSNVWAVAVQPDGKVYIGGDFTHVNGTARNHLARLNSDGTLDTTFDPGTVFNDSVYALALKPSSGQIFVGGSFTGVGGYGYDCIALVNTNGTLNTSFNPGTGPDNTVFALCWQPNGQLLLGGAFADINGTLFNRIARLNTNGSIDTAGFFPGTGADDTVYSIVYSTNVITSVTVSSPPAGGSGSPVTSTIIATNYLIYAGGSFTSFNGTRRLGFARLYTDGTLDTTFLDTAYNQFAGLPRIYFQDTPASVYTCGVQSDGNVMIAGSFNEVGGGQADKRVRDTVDTERGIQNSFDNYDLWVSENRVNIEPKARDGIRNRSNVARLIGGAINGPASLLSPVNAYAPGNIGLVYDSYSANQSDFTRDVELTRANGGLGSARVNFAVQPGLAQSGVDYVYNASDPLFWIAWEYTDLKSRMHSHGLFGTNGVLEDIYGRAWWGNGITLPSGVTITLHPDLAVRGDLNAQFQLANPADADQFYLGGQNIPLGVALGRSTAPFALVDDNKQSGQFGFAASSFVAANSSVPAAISVVRSNGTYGRYSVTCSTSNGTATNGVDYIGLSQSKFFSDGVLGVNVFNVTVRDNGIIYTNPVEMTVNLRLSGLSGPVDGNGTYGISNAVLRLINPSYKGYLSLSTNNYIANESAGFITFVVNRTSGSQGALSVQYATADGTAASGVDYIGATNTLSWTNGDVSPRPVSITLPNTYTVGPNKQFTVSLRNPATNGVSDPSLMVLPIDITNATLTINNDSSYGTLQFSAPSYFVNENGGFATITVIRTGGAAGSASVNFATADGPNAWGDPGYATTNFVATNGVLTFMPNQLAASFNVQLIDDGVQDPANFYFNVSLSGAVNAALGSPNNVPVNILDAQSYNRPPGSPGTGTNSISGANDSVLALALQPNGQILVGGNFTEINSVPENYVARLNADGSLDTTFPNVLNAVPGANGPVNALAVQTNGRILVGGSFTSMNGDFLSHVARLMTDGSIDTSFNPGPGADGVVNALAETFVGGVRKIYVGGAFGHIYNWSVASPGISRLNDDGTLDASFATGLGPDGAVSAIAVYPTNSIYAGKVLIGGAFTHYNGTNVNYIVRLNADGSVDTTFHPGSAANGAVSALAIQPDGRVLVGGSFIQFNGTPLNRIARLNADGSRDDGFTAAIGSGANNTVEGIALQADNRIVLVGLFTQVGGLTCYRIVRLLPSGAVDTTINFGDGANNDVNALVLQPWDGMMIIGGAFTQFNDQPYDHLVRLYGGSSGGSIPAGGSLIVPAGSALVSDPNGNGIIDPGENVTVAFALRDSAGSDVSNLKATLLVTNGIMSPSPASASYGSLSVGGPSASRQFSFTNSGANGQLITATFQLQSTNSLGVTNNLGTASFNFLLGTLTNTFVNPGLIVINDKTNSSPAGMAASPYPSIINVSGVGGSLIKATVTFTKLTHTWPADIDALLESPIQQNVLLMANEGAGFAVNGVTLTFDANGPALPQTGQIVSGTYKPTASFPVATFPVPAPSAPSPSYSTNLPDFNGSNPNGGWSLFVMDDQAINAGAISNGWSLNLITASPVGTPADAGISMKASPSPASVSNNVTFVIAVTNYGPSPSAGVTVLDALPPGAAFVSATDTLGSYTTNGGVLTWTVGSLTANAGATLSLVVLPKSVGFITNSALVSSSTADLNPDDNLASIIVPVGATQPPQFGTITNSNGTLRFTVISQPGQTNVIQGSTNLVNWVPIYTNVGSFIFTDPNAANYRYRFYRDRILGP